MALKPVPESPALAPEYAFVKLPILAPGPNVVSAKAPTPGANEVDNPVPAAFVTKDGLT